MKILVIAILVALSTTTSAQKADEINTWADLANNKNYVLGGPCTWSEEDSTYICEELDYTETFSLNEDANELTITQIHETYLPQEYEDGQGAVKITTNSKTAKYSVEINGEYLDYLGPISGNIKPWFKSLELVKQNGNIGLYDYTKKQIRYLIILTIVDDNIDIETD